jgi:hypothetical protein
MPTNKLWLEHTERAAWQSVQALREKLVEAERREERLAPPVEGWRELFAALDSARSEQSIPGESYAELLRGVLSRLRDAEERLRTAEQASQKVPPPAKAPEPLRSSTRSQRAPFRPGWEADDDPDEPARGERRLFGEIKARYAEFVRDRVGFDPAAVLADAQARLEDLPGLDPAELFDVAADLGALSLVLARGSED